VAKRKGSNAVAVADALRAEVAELRRDVIPHDVEARITRDDGATADEKVTELIRELGLAVVIVAALVMVALG
jgi:multidrug efflux pump subunit AcrB